MANKKYEHIRKALSETRKDGKQFAISEETLHRHLKQTAEDIVFQAGTSYLTSQHEHILADHCLQMEQYGCATSRQLILKLASDMTEAIGCKPNPTGAWLSAFLSRFPTLKLSQKVSSETNARDNTIKMRKLWKEKLANLKESRDKDLKVVDTVRGVFELEHDMEEDEISEESEDPMETEQNKPSTIEVTPSLSSTVELSVEPSFLMKEEPPFEQATDEITSSPTMGKKTPAASVDSPGLDALINLIELKTKVAPTPNNDTDTNFWMGLLPQIKELSKTRKRKFFQRVTNMLFSDLDKQEVEENETAADTYVVYVDNGNLSNAQETVHTDPSSTC